MTGVQNEATLSKQRWPGTGLSPKTAGSQSVNQPSGQYICVNCVFCVVFDCWMTYDGRWYCQTIFGHPDIAKVMQLLGDGERLRVVARILHLPPSVVGRLRGSYQET